MTKFTKLNLLRRTSSCLPSIGWGKFLWVISTVFLTAGMIFNPRLVFEGASTGLKTWWNIVFPSLLPFFIVSELLMNFGIVHFMGILLEPVMRPLFNVPGTGSLVVAIGFTSGYPIGSMVTAQLKSQGLCTKTEAERLVSFTNNASPLFMLVAVAVGMFNNPELGVLIAGTHYLASITLGIALRFYARDTSERYTTRSLPSYNGNFKVALCHLLQTLNCEKRSPGVIVGDAVRNAVNNLLNIGGFIILFAVIIKLLDAAGIIDILAGLLGFALFPFKFSPNTLRALACGFFEITTGTKMASEVDAPLTEKLTAVSMILGWSGLSIHAQAAALVRGTDIGMKVFLISRLGHACLAGTYTFIFLKSPIMLIKTTSTPNNLPFSLVNQDNNPLIYSCKCLLVTGMLFLIMAAVAFFIPLLKKVTYILTRK